LRVAWWRNSFSFQFIQFRLALSSYDNEPKLLSVRNFYCCRFSRYARLITGRSFTFSVFASVGTLEMTWTLFNPWITSPKTVYLPFQSGLGRRQMKNWLEALFGSLARAAPTVPRTKGRVLNSAGTLGWLGSPIPHSSRFPPPRVCGSPPWMMKSGST